MKKATPPAPEKQAEKNPSDGFTFSSGAAYGDKDEFVSKDLVFSITEIEFQNERGFDGADRWAITVAIDGRPDEILTLGSNEKRDLQLAAAQTFLASSGPIHHVHLRKSGKAYYFETAQMRT